MFQPLGYHQASACDIRHKTGIQTYQTNLNIILTVTEKIRQEKYFFFPHILYFLKVCVHSVQWSAPFLRW